MANETAATAVREIIKAFEELVPVNVLRDRAFAIALELQHPAYHCFYLALAERSTSRLDTADERLIRRCAGTPFRKLVQSL
jgi:predicted nucleic acid-binding protein